MQWTGIKNVFTYLAAFGLSDAAYGLCTVVVRGLSCFLPWDVSSLTQDGTCVPSYQVDYFLQDTSSPKEFLYSGLILCNCLPTFQLHCLSTKTSLMPSGDQETVRVESRLHGPEWTSTTGWEDMEHTGKAAWKRTLPTDGPPTSSLAFGEDATRMQGGNTKIHARNGSRGRRWSSLGILKGKKAGS